MRPAGDVRRALLDACAALARADRGPTLRELAAQACVGLSAAEYTVANMCRAGLLRAARTRRVPYRNRPVAEYEPIQAPALPPPPSQGLARVMTAWEG